MQENVRDQAFHFYTALRRIREHVDEYYSSEISLGIAARIAGMERTYFSAFFRRKVGVTFTFWLASVRIAKAKTLIETSDHSITEIGYAVGFESSRTFERAFKKHEQLTPRQFRECVKAHSETEGTPGRVKLTEATHIAVKTTAVSSSSVYKFSR